MYEELFQRLEEFARRKGLILSEKLGFGVHGLVVVAEKHAAKSALKAHKFREGYRRELEAYQRLKTNGVAKIHGFHVPQLINADDELLVIQMSVVSKPYLLDFAGICLDRPPDFSEEILEEWERDKSEQFGAGWPAVLDIIQSLKGYGIYLTDVSPSNVGFE